MLSSYKRHTERLLHIKNMLEKLLGKKKKKDKHSARWHKYEGVLLVAHNVKNCAHAASSIIYRS